MQLLRAANNVQTAAARQQLLLDDSAVKGVFTNSTAAAGLEIAACPGGKALKMPP